MVAKPSGHKNKNTFRQKLAEECGRTACFHFPLLGWYNGANARPEVQLVRSAAQVKCLLGSGVKLKGHFSHIIYCTDWLFVLSESKGLFIGFPDSQLCSFACSSVDFGSRYTLSVIGKSDQLFLFLNSTSIKWTDLRQELWVFELNLSTFAGRWLIQHRNCFWYVFDYYCNLSVKNDISHNKKGINFHVLYLTKVRHEQIYDPSKSMTWAAFGFYG